ncbi:protealysin inhibitor emfourin [Arthrobacter citreus]|uniref:Protealysin inhibitor emfourin n=1 Tax=Arthrobacter citreus TaxID=1670 RepID=A0ABZ2ZV51_9MICC
MRIVVVRTGGFAGLTRVWSTQVSSEEAEQEWLPLLQNPPPQQPGGPDRFVYEIQVGQAAVTLPEHCVQGRWRDLVDRARQAGENGPGQAGSDGGGDSAGKGLQGEFE